jgi:hypothetical protein
MENDKLTNIFGLLLDFFDFLSGFFFGFQFFKNILFFKIFKSN